MTESGGSSGSEGRGDGESVDSFLRGVARAPHKFEVDGRTPAEFGPKLRLDAGAVVGGRFRLERRLGEGGMGVVWQAVHAVTHKPVALKFLKDSAASEPRAVQRFLREARAACAVRHPCVVAVHDVLELEDGSPMMVMDLLAGETFAKRLAREGALPLPEVARIMVHVCSAVGSAHALGIVHRDLKPENIFLARSLTGASEVKVLDFGIAKLTASENEGGETGGTTATGAILGTPYYMAPEQLFGERDVDHRADIWALGIILYEALVGARPTQGPNVGQVYKLVMTDGIPPISEKAAHLPTPIVTLVSRMLARNRVRRPDDVREVLATLSQYTDEAFVPVEAAPVRAGGAVESFPDPAPKDPAEPSASDAKTIAIERSGARPLEKAALAAPARRFSLRTAILVASAAIAVPLLFVAWLSRAIAPEAPRAGLQPANLVSPSTGVLEHSPALVTEPKQVTEPTRPPDRSAASLTPAVSTQPSPTPARSPLRPTDPNARPALFRPPATTVPPRASAAMPSSSAPARAVDPGSYL
jgi:serine/threonine protein kinase